jgi:rhodanese-related sulfurtransferase
MIDNMTVTELKKKLDSGEELLLIDCREQAEWNEAHIENANFHPLSQFQAEIEKLEGRDKETVIVCQCRSGKRSLQAATMLQGEGYENLFNLEGGILAWIDEGYPTLSQE